MYSIGCYPCQILSEKCLSKLLHIYNPLMGLAEDFSMENADDYN